MTETNIWLFVALSLVLLIWWEEHNRRTPR